MADGSSSTTTTVLSISTAALALASAYFGYKTYNNNKDLRAFHDAINKLPPNSASIPANIIPAGMMQAMMAMK